MQKIIQKFKKYSIAEIINILDERYGLGKLELHLNSKWYNPLASVYICFRSLPFFQAIKLPIAIYGWPRFFCLSGKIKIQGKTHFKMIKVNTSLAKGPGNGSRTSEIFNTGEIIFNGPATIGSGCKINVYRNACLSFGINVYISHDCIFSSFKHITIGAGTRIAHRSQIMDSDYHYSANMSTHTVRNQTLPIHIGTKCWIANSTSVMKGSYLPDYTIIGSNSLVNKDFSKLEPGSVIGGQPAKLIAQNIWRVRNNNINSQLNKYFSDPENVYSKYQLPEKITIEQLANE